MNDPAASAGTAVVVVAAGRGERFGRPKADLELAGEPLWRHAVSLFGDIGVDRVVLVGDVPGGISGGERRRDSVRAGLAAVEDARYVLVHDVARPLATPEVVRRVLDRLRAGDVDAVVPAVAVSDTVKRTEGERVVTTIDRSNLVAVQTPQGFRMRALLAAHDSSPVTDATDDAALVEEAGGRVVVVKGDPENLKITWPGDLLVAEAILAGRNRG